MDESALSMSALAILHSLATNPAWELLPRRAFVRTILPVAGKCPRRRLCVQVDRGTVRMSDLA